MISEPSPPENAPKPAPVSPVSAAPAPSAPPPEPAVPPSTLTPEEQMALFEKELKETDWGHQPC